MSPKGDDKDLTNLLNVETTKEHDDKSEQLESLTQQLAIDEHGRDKKIRNMLSWCLRGLIILVFTIVALAIGGLSFHTLAPTEWHWLSNEQIQDLKNFILSGAMVSVAISYLRKYLS